jgi:hypothetical protein
MAICRARAHGKLRGLVGTTAFRRRAIYRAGVRSKLKGLLVPRETGA